MDKATQEYRRRMKANRSKRGELSNFEPRGYGRANRRHETFPTGVCEFVAGGSQGYVKRERKNGTFYQAGPLILGGHRCANPALSTTPTLGKRCAEHLGRQSDALVPQEKSDKRARSKRKAKYLG